MYKINHIIDSKNCEDFIELSNSINGSYAKIYLNDGASLQELILSGHPIIKDMSPMIYENTYASSILFPFANRVKDGRYQFNSETFQFDINEKPLNNALHGLVYNKTFEVTKKIITNNQAMVRLRYVEANKHPGFPYTYSIYLEYVLTERGLDLNLEIKNTDSNTFPFTVGWHPYFFSSDLYNSSVIFDANKKVKLDNRNITEDVVVNEHVDAFKLNNQQLDDCYVLNSRDVLFITPSYNLELKSSEPDSFLQLYTPPHKNTIAIEPTTGVSDSFNNGIGLKTLKPNDTYNISWKLKIKDN